MNLRLAVIPISPTGEIIKEHMPDSMALNFQRLEPSLFVLRCSQRYRVRLQTTRWSVYIHVCPLSWQNLRRGNGTEEWAAGEETVGEPERVFGGSRFYCL